MTVGGWTLTYSGSRTSGCICIARWIQRCDDRLPSLGQTRCSSGSALSEPKPWCGENHPAPRVINTDKHAGYPPAIAGLQAATTGKPDVLLIGTGSEVSLCLNAQEALKKQGVEARVISMPWWKRFSVTTTDQSACLCRTSCKIRLGTVCRNRWGARRHENLWGISAFAEAHKEIWLYSRGCRCCCHRAVQ